MIPRWIVGGPSRCGKTQLVLALWQHAGPVAGFPLEALFTVYNTRWLPSSERARALLAEYVTRPRYTDTSRAEFERPAQYFSSTPGEIASRLPSGLRHPLAIIGWFLDSFASENGRTGWAAFDLHPEFLYARFRRRLPGLKLVVMTRDPREAICAALFWRGDPGKARDNRFKHRLILYCLSKQTGESLARRWPSDVQVVNFNLLVTGDKKERERIARLFGIAGDAVGQVYDLKPHFELDSSRGFLFADGEYRQVLTATEFAEISALAGTGPSPVEAKPRWLFLAMARLILTIGRLAPSFARAVADLIYDPRRYVWRRINNIRQLVADLGRARTAA